ncbi:excinuclease ABC subunit C [bacterium (Candidatus Blackallbacteria) CG17_big_fil_post_rev_8_21_14_2_50_48_46]|uniref:UvrABC system protein C n=1 Tax=bacterium (Candidatus Blackallbacteria) CG17_big_fil_post_rev_8_21_14_2_50_48_46 TaxID=2014261 RepID=A0A2M7FYI6_9BACT|nr:MAG: excinuclease ABC subunit C [bacterium (Candidatus Blackallbacteria) CG18_big_fil_WC_8_21_14_2_50_49_26]PIW14386.1 MAG: excinuclease ABC subunit C [bacterium (Candidatus Blackallbacteria) CG17_big_fil_post_rev_8_21_14_2_50_48_46]PIW46893.1 MAG: excinuclease ABC subunit C [bacterium (Candidatus Blackallbacteria) CG13_big_fil_rev_8_21_14_2_50_49_14]
MDLQEQLKLIPSQPGVYLMHDHAGQIIYIGKARSLTHRVRSYFQTGRPLHGPKIEKMVEQVTRIETIITDTEVEALVLEEQLIRKYQPKYNTLLKNSKGFPYIRINWQDAYPRVEMVRQRQHKDKSLYFGPYPSASAINGLLAAIREIFPVEKCKDPRKEKQVCIYFQIKRCLGHCQKKVSSEAYKDMLQDIRLFLEGKSQVLREKLEARMRSHAAQMQYEQAAQMRDILAALQRYIVPTQNQKIVGKPEWNLDLIHMARNPLMCHLAVFPVREGILQTPLPHTFSIRQEDEPSEILTRFLYQFYSRDIDIPPEILLPQELEEPSLMENWLRERRQGKVGLHCPQRGEKKALLEMVEKNALAGLKKAESDAHYDLALEGLEELRQLLELKHPPHLIEGFDISHFQGQETVASLVALENGMQAKALYRRYKIRSAEGIPNDFVSMEEVVSRRYRKLAQENQALPDLILIDGGKGQVSAAMRAFDKAGLKPPALVGLAKKEELLIFPDRHEPVRLPRHSPALKLLQQLRDEAHRFALTYHRSLRKKRTLHSELDRVPGIGAHRPVHLLQVFGSLDKIKKAELQELMLKGGLPRKVAQTVYQYFRK